MNDPIKILIIEDDQFLAQIYPAKMAKSGHITEVALNGRDGLIKYKKFKPDIILLDLILPYMNGFEVMTELKKRKNTVPIIVISNLGQDSDVKKAMDLGAYKYFIKSSAELRDILQEVETIIEEQEAKKNQH